jgi:methyl-accepting chemotaxis protein
MSILNQFSIKFKFIILLTVVLSVMGGSTVYTLHDRIQTYSNAKTEKVKSVIDTAYNRAKDLHDIADQRGLSEEYIRSLFYSEVGSMIYDNGDGYLFLYDSKGNVLKNRPNPKLEGTNRIAVKDVNGNPYIEKIVNLAKSQGEGSVAYFFNKPGQQEPSEKMAYFRYFKPLDIIIITGIYMDDLRAKETLFINQAVFGGGGLLIFVILFFTLIMLDFNKALKQLRTSMVKLSEDDLDISIDHKRKDEFSRLFECLDIFKLSIEKRIHLEGQAAADKHALEEQTKAKIQQITGDISLSSSLVEEHITGISSAAAELSSTLEDIGMKVEETSQMTNLAQEEAEKGSSTIHELDKSAEKIGEVVQLIKAIADKTNLLALNASIEAARAGDEGRGFAVVAEEVKKLAAQTANATSEISNQVDMIQSNSDSSVQSIENITQQINSINEFTQTLVVAMVEQKTATNEISESMTLASEGAKDVSNKIKEIRE